MFSNSHTHNNHSNKLAVLQLSLEEKVSVPYSIGIHPWETTKYQPTQVQNLLESNSTPHLVAIGECGLDKLQGASIAHQIAIFEEHIYFSEKNNYPLIIHCVKAWNELTILHQKHQPKQPWIFHGFMKYAILKEVVQSNLMISLGAGILTHSKGEAIILAIPDHQLLIETDDSEIEIKRIYEHVAQIKKISLQQLNELVTQNFLKTFTWCQIG